MRHTISNPVFILTLAAPLILSYFYIVGEVDPDFKRLGRALEVAMINSLTIFTAAWFFSGTGFLKILYREKKTDAFKSETSTPLIILIFSLLYLLNLQLLQLIVAHYEQSVLDRGYIVVLIAALFLSIERSIIICCIAIIIRLGFYLYLTPHLFWGENETYPLLNYNWFMFYPGILALSAAFLTGTLCRLYFQNNKAQAIPTWVGFTLAILIEPIYLGALLYQTDISYVTQVLTVETVPNIMAIGGTMTVLLYMLHGLYADRQLNHAKKAELALLQENLRYLRVQMNPHFLFNTLNTISHFISEKPAYAKELLLDFSEMFRHVVHDETLLVSLQKELEFIKMYISLEKARLGKRLQVSYEIKDNTLSWQIPTLILQPLIENAIKHGFSEQHKEVKIKLSCSLQNQTLLINLSDNGKGIHNTSQPSKNQGISLINIRKRLQLLYDDNAKLQINSSLGKGTRVTVIIPEKHSMQIPIAEEKTNAFQ